MSVNRSAAVGPPKSPGRSTEKPESVDRDTPSWWTESPKSVDRNRQGGRVPSHQTSQTLRPHPNSSPTTPFRLSAVLLITLRRTLMHVGRRVSSSRAESFAEQGGESSHPWVVAMSAWRVGACRRADAPGSARRVGTCQRADPDPVGRPTPSMPACQLSEASMPRIPRGLGDRPQKAVRSTYRHRQTDRTSRDQLIDRPPHTRYNDSTPFDISTRPKSIERPVPCRYIDICHRYGKDATKSKVSAIQPFVRATM